MAFGTDQPNSAQSKFAPVVPFENIERGFIQARFNKDIFGSDSFQLEIYQQGGQFLALPISLSSDEPVYVFNSLQLIQFVVTFNEFTIYYGDVGLVFNSTDFDAALTDQDSAIGPVLAAFSGSSWPYMAIWQNKL